MVNLLAGPIVLPLLVGALLLVFRPPEHMKRLCAVATTCLLLVLPVLFGRLMSSEGVLSLQVGGWEPPFGIVLAVDWLSVLMLFFCNLVGFCVVLYACFRSTGPASLRPYFYALILFQLAGVNGALSTGDLFNLYVWYEVMLIASYALVARGGGRATMKGMPDYVVLNVLASVLFLVGVGLTYASFGTVNLAHLGLLVQRGHVPDWMAPLAMVFFVVFATKSAAFPLYFWIYRGYPVASSTVAALLGGLLTKVGIYSFLRVFTLMFPGQFGVGVGWTRGVFYVVGTASILVGVFGAVSRREWRNILSHHITSQIGYMIAGIGLWTPLALAGTLYFTLHNIVVKSSLFLIGGVTGMRTGTTRLKSQGGLLATLPFAAGLFVVASFSLAGLPPMSGFFSKFALFRAAVNVAGPWGYWVLTAGVVGGLFTLYSMVKIWRLAFMGSSPEDAAEHAVPGGVYTGPGLLVVASLLMGLAGGPIMHLASRASHQLLNPGSYIGHVLRTSPVLPSSKARVLVPASAASDETLIHVGSPASTIRWDQHVSQTTAGKRDLETFEAAGVLTRPGEVGS